MALVNHSDARCQEHIRPRAFDNLERPGIGRENPSPMRRRRNLQMVGIETGEATVGRRAIAIRRRSGFGARSQQ